MTDSWGVVPLGAQAMGLFTCFVLAFSLAQRLIAGLEASGPFQPGYGL
jgi:hypothetical protein